MLKKRKGIVITVLVVLVIVFGLWFVLRGADTQSALSAIGLRAEHTIVCGADENGHIYKVQIASNVDNKKHECALVRVQKNALDVWTVADAVRLENAESARASMQWRVKTYSMNAEMPKEQWHYLYYYISETKITPKIKAEQLPRGVAVETLVINGWQKVVHLTTYLPPEKMAEVDVFALLKENGCIL